ncbi:metallothionein [Vreelandella populi]
MLGVLTEEVNMSQQQCACPKCDCSVDSQAIEKNGQKFCSESCAIGHTDGSTGCGHGCSCGK